MEAGEDQALLVVNPAFGVFHLPALQQHESMEDAQPVVPLHDPVPKITDRVFTFRSGWIAGSTVIAPVEGQEKCGLTGQSGGHVDFRIGQGEVHHRAPPEAQQWLHAARGRTLGLALHPILLPGGLHRLGEVGLDLHRGHRQAVDEEHQIDGVLVVQGIAQLPHHAQAVGGVAGSHRLVAAVFRFGLTHGQGARTRHRKAPAKHLQGAAGPGGQRFDQPVQHRGFRIRAMNPAQLLPGLRLGIPKPADDILGIEGAGTVIGLMIAFQPSLVLELIDDVFLEADLVVGFGHAFIPQTNRRMG